MGATKINGVVIENIDYDDFAKIVKVFSQQYGKISFIAPGVNKENSKNRYSIQTFSLSEFEIFKARKLEKTSKLKTGLLKKYYFNISQNFTNYIYASIIIKILDQINQINNKNNQIFNALLTCLQNINDDRNPFLNYLLFITQIVQDSIQPIRLKKCVRCKKTNYPIVRFEYSENGLICKRCIWPGEIIQPQSFIDLLFNIGHKSFLYNIEQKYNYTDLIIWHNIIINYYENFLGFYLGPIYLLKNGPAFDVSENIQKLYK